MKRLMEKIVFSGLVMACRLATCPTNRSPLLVNATTDGVVRWPSWFAITVGWPASITATHEFVVPKSMPIIFPICLNAPSILYLKVLRWRAAGRGGLVQPHYQSLVGYCQVLFECVGLNSTVRARSARICTSPGWPSNGAVTNTCMPL